jgi:hypothetical protein
MNIDLARHGRAFATLAISDRRRQRLSPNVLRDVNRTLVSIIVISLQQRRNRQGRVLGKICQLIRERFVKRRPRLTAATSKEAESSAPTGGRDPTHPRPCGIERSRGSSQNQTEPRGGRSSGFPN